MVFRHILVTVQTFISCRPGFLLDFQEIQVYNEERIRLISIEIIQNINKTNRRFYK
ncbi:MAG: hypothetical protein Q4B74_00735 [Eubacteriales bacterium]|nr:hypothetical protein [Eubacteriales bacterium]